MDGTLVGAVNVWSTSPTAHAENALRAAAESLRASNAVKDEFLGLVSHELRTPVTTIFGNARLLEDRGDSLSDEYRQSMIADIAADSERLLGIVENLLLLTKLESGPQIDLEPQVLGHVIGSSVEGFRQKRPGRDVTLSVEDGVGIVEADRTYLELLMDNLLTNAHKYSPPATPIEVEVTFDDGEARVSVLDRGIGIAEEEIRPALHPLLPERRGQGDGHRASGSGSPCAGGSSRSRAAGSGQRAETEVDPCSGSRCRTGRSSRPD